MLEMNVPDMEFAHLLARWCLQFDDKTRHSGGSTNFDLSFTGSSAEVIQASFQPFKPPHRLFSDFTSEWSSQPYFRHARPLLSVVFTALSMRFKTPLSKKLRGMRNWYHIGIKDAEHLSQAADKLVSLNRPIVMFGRDCLSLYRVCYGTLDKLAYVEGLSRPLVRWEGEYNREANKAVITAISEYVQEVCQRVMHVNGRDAVLVDTGFRGSIPKAVFSALRLQEFARANDTLYLSSFTPGADDVRMLTSEGFNPPSWNLGLVREKTVKTEYRPKVFLRAERWVRVDASDYEVLTKYVSNGEILERIRKLDPSKATSFYDSGKSRARDLALGNLKEKNPLPKTKVAKIPNLVLSGDVPNAACYLIGVMAATAERRKRNRR